MLHAQPAGRGEVLGHLVAEDLQGTLHPGARRRPRHAPSGAGWRRRSWRAGWRWPAPRGASAAPPRPAPTRARRAGSAARRSRRRPGRPRGPRRAPRGPWPRSAAGGPRRPGRAPPPGRGRSPPGRRSGRARSASRAPGRPRARPPPRRRWPRRPPAGAAPGSGGPGRPPARSAGPAGHRRRPPARRSGEPRRSPPGAITISSELWPKISRMSLLEPPGRHRGVQLRLDHDPPAHQVQAAGEPQNRRDLRLPAAGPGDGEPGDLVLHRCRHRHGPILPCIRKIRSYAAASSSGSCRRGTVGRGPPAPARPSAPSRSAASVERRRGRARRPRRPAPRPGRV